VVLSGSIRITFRWDSWMNLVELVENRVVNTKKIFYDNKRRFDLMEWALLDKYIEKLYEIKVDKLRSG